MSCGKLLLWQLDICSTLPTTMLPGPIKICHSCEAMNLNERFQTQNYGELGIGEIEVTSTFLQLDAHTKKPETTLNFHENSIW